MLLHHGVCRLPVELLALVFDSLSLQELITASHVAHYWRDAALRHKTFWRDIALGALSAAALDLFLARLDAGSERSVTIRVYLQEVSIPARLRSVVLPAVSRNLYRVDKLHLEIDIAYDSDVFSALQKPAPRLETLDLSMIHDTQTSDELPVDLFACRAPRLRNVQLLNVQFWPDRLPSVLSRVTELQYCFNEAQFFPTALFPHCPVLQKLVIYGKYCALAMDEAQSTITAARQLRSIDISVFSGSFDFVQRVPCASISQIFVSINDKESAPLLLAHLRGPLELRLYQTAYNAYVQYEAPDTGMQRGFVCLPGQVAEAYLPPVHVSDAVVSRVRRLHTTGGCAGLLPAFRELRSCTRVSISLADGEPLNPPPRLAAIPSLERVDISSNIPALIRADDLTTFLDRTFAPVSRSVQVSLAGIVVDGDCSALGERFLVSVVN